MQGPSTPETRRHEEQYRELARRSVPAEQKPEYGDALARHVYRPYHPDLKDCASYLLVDGAGRVLERVGGADDDAPRVRMVRRQRRALGRALQKKFREQRRAAARAST